MEFGRVIRAWFQDGSTKLYVVAEQDAATAENVLAAKLEPGTELEHVDHASLRLPSRHVAVPRRAQENGPMKNALATSAQSQSHQLPAGRCGMSERAKLH